MISIVYESLSIRWRNLAKFTAVCLMAGFVFVAAYAKNPTTDWYNFFQPASLAMAAGKVEPAKLGTFNPPWAYLFLIPIAYLPTRLGTAIIATLTLLGFLAAARKLKASLLGLVLIAVIPHFSWMLFTANLDFMVLFGLALPPAWGLPLVLVKPQIGLIVAMYWGLQAWQQGRLIGVIKLLGPMAALAVICLIQAGPGAFDFRGAFTMVGFPHNQSFYPWSLPIGLGLLGLAYYKKQVQWAILAGPLVAPYVGYYSWPVALLGLAANPYDVLAAGGFLTLTFYLMNVHVCC